MSEGRTLEERRKKKPSLRIRTNGEVCTILPALTDAQVCLPTLTDASSSNSPTSPTSPWLGSALLSAKEQHTPPMANTTVQDAPLSPKNKAKLSLPLAPHGSAKKTAASGAPPLFTPAAVNTANEVVETWKNAVQDGLSPKSRSRVNTDDWKKFNDSLQLPEALSRQTSRESQGGESNREWSIVLLGQTFANGQTVKQVAESLANVFCVDVAQAEGVAEKGSCDQECITLGVYDTQREAMVIAQRLRDLSLVVRVTSVVPPDTPKGNCLKRFAKQFSTGDEQCAILRLAGRVQKQYKSNGDSAPLLKAKDQSRYLSDFGARPSTQDSAASTTDANTSEWFSECGQTSPLSPLQRSKPSRWKMVRQQKEKIVEMGQDLKEGPEDESPEQIEPTQKRRMSVELKVPHAISSGGRVLKGSALKSACKLARTFIFGDVTDGNLSSQIKRDYALRMGLQEVLGTRSMVKILHQVWAKLDADRGGSVDIDEFREFRQMTKANNPLSIAETDELEALLFAKDARPLVLEDMMRLIWPAAGQKELITMMEWCAEHDHETKRDWVRTPPILPKPDRDGLRSVFSNVAGSPDGKVSFMALVREGFMHEYQRDEFQRVWDQNGDGLLDVLEFCEMMCPVGFRAHEDAKTGKLADGRTVYYDVGRSHWFPDLNEM